MKRILIVTAILAAACGSVDGRGECSSSAGCPVGQYCAGTPDGNVCWADAAPPTVSGVTASCGGACLRDSMLQVTATIADGTSDVLDASVAIDLGGPAVAMTRQGTTWRANVDLRQVPFDFFAHDVVARVTARDGARNVAAPTSAAAVPVTRLKWTYDAGAPLTSPAVMADGTVVVGVSAAADQVLAVRDGTKVWSRTVGGTAFVTAAPAVGRQAIWVGSQDFSLYAVELDGSAVKAGVGVNVGGAIKGSVAVLAAGAKEWAFATANAGDGTGFVGVSSTVASEKDVTPAPLPQEGFMAGPVIGPGDVLHAPTATPSGTATLRSYVLNTAPVSLNATWTAAIGKRSAAPLSVAGDGAVLSGSDDAPPRLVRTVPGPTPTSNIAGILDGIVADSAVALSNGDVIVGDEAGRIHRIGASGPVWSSVPNLGAPVRGLLALNGTDTRFIVPTSDGKVHALGEDGHSKWSGTLPSAVGLRAANIFTPPGQAAGPTMSLAYLASENGHLYAVIIDGQLDASAPWPKAFHDPRNTNRAGPQP